MSFPTAQVRERQRERIKYWLLKDRELTNRQLTELTGATDSVISKIRKEIGIPANFGVPTYTAIDTAFKKFMKGQGKPIQRQSKEFNPWPPAGNSMKEDT
jgi:hypothetical protein